MIKTGLAISLLLSSPLLAGAPTKEEVMQLGYGVTQVDLTGHQLDTMVVLANRENFNADGFDVLSLYMKTPGINNRKPIWSIVPIFDEEMGRKEQLVITVSGCADCCLHDFRLVRIAKDQTPLQIIAAREFE
jgi:hypothetical protein